MPNFPRTDLAVEAEAIHRRAAVTELPGVRAEETNRRGFSVTEVHVLAAAGENALCKPIGDYYTLALDPLLRREDDAFENAAQTLAELLRGVLPLMPDASVLVVGLGNRAITPDAVGPDAIDSVMVTRHLREQLPELEILEYEPMRAHCSFRIGGPARALVRPASAEETAAVCRIVRGGGAQPLLIGNGTNLLITDGDVDRIVVQMGERMADVARTDATHLRAGAGIPLARLAQAALGYGLAGLEFAHGIPGSLGGAVSMNAGAYGGEMKDVVVSTRYLDHDLNLCEAEGVAHDFGYRHSVFSDTDCVVLGSTLALTPGDPAEIRARMLDLSERRRRRQPLDLPSAGSTFKRPAGGYAAALIDAAGLKGYAGGGAQVSEKHAGFVVNRGGATFDDVLRLMDHIRSEVLRTSGVELEPEVKIIRG